MSANERGKQMGSTRMDGPLLVYTATSQASAAGGTTQYAFVSCFGAKSVAFFIRTAAGVPTLNTPTIDIDPGPGISIVTGISSLGYEVISSPGFFQVAAGDTGALFGSTNLRFVVDRIAPRITLAASATGVSCWAVTQWD